MNPVKIQGLACYDTISRISEAVGAAGMSHVAVLILSRVAASGEAGIFQQSVQRELELSPATMTRHLHRLVIARLVIQSSDFQRDGRPSLLKLTHAGRAVFTQLD